MTQFGTLVAKEFRVEARTRELFTGGLLLALLLLLVGNLAWGRLGRPEDVAPGLLWVTVVFAGVLTVGRNLHRERDRGTWEALALLPVDWGVIYLAKVTANFLVLLIIEAVAVPMFAWLFDYDLWTSLPKLSIVFLLGTLGFTAAGTLLTAIGAHARARELLAPILMIPLLIPLLMMSIQATQKILAGLPSSELLAEHEILIAFDAIFLAIGWLTFDYILGE